jgi:hypothetical protein
MDSVQRSLADNGGLDNGQEKPRLDSGWALELINLTSGRERQQIKGRSQLQGVRKTNIGDDKIVTETPGSFSRDPRPDT